MPELPRYLPQTTAQPGAYSNAANLHNDVGIGNIVHGINAVAEGIQQYEELLTTERVSNALGKASDDHIQFLQEQSVIEQSIPDPQAYQEASGKLAKTYLHDRNKQTLEYFKGDVKALAIYKQHLNPQVEATFAESIKNATQRRIMSATPMAKSTGDKLMRDALAFGPGSPVFNPAIEKLDDFYTSLSPVLVPNKELLRQASFDQLYMGLALNKARSDPQGTLRQLAEGTFSVEMIRGHKVPALSPEMQEGLVTEAYQQMTRDQNQVATNLAIDKRVYEQGQKTLEARTQLKLMQDDPDALNLALGKNGLDETGRPLLDADAVRDLYNFKQGYEKARVEGRVTKPEAFGMAETQVRNGTITSSIQVMNLPDIDFDNKKILVSFLHTQAAKLQDHDYSSYHAALKRGEDYIRGMVLSKNPISGMGAVDMTAESLVQQYYSQMDAQERGLAMTNAKYMSLRPVDVAAEFMTKQVPFIAQSYRHSEQKLVRRLSEFMPSGQVPTYNQLFNNIDKSQGIGRTEKLILKSLALQLKQQGTTEQMLPGLLGRITAEQKPESDSYFNKLFQGTRERFEDAKKWLGTLDAGENAGQ